jgi:hypothetical protein
MGLLRLLTRKSPRDIKLPSSKKLKRIIGEAKKFPTVIDIVIRSCIITDLKRRSACNYHISYRLRNSLLHEICHQFSYPKLEDPSELELGDDIKPFRSYLGKVLHIIEQGGIEYNIVQL